MKKIYQNKYVRKMSEAIFFLMPSMVFILISFFKNCHAILDGRVTPIYLENRYSFSNFEWARGDVYFKSGFDLPTNGTVVMDITQEVRGKILFRNSTLRLFNDLRMALDGTLSGSGFVDAQNNSIFLKNDWKFSPTDRFVFISNVSFVGVNNNAIDFSNAGSTGGITFGRLGVMDDIYVKQLILGPFSGNNFNLATFRPTRLHLVNTTLRLGATSRTLNSWEVKLYGHNRVSATGNVQLSIPQRLFIEAYASLYISQGLTLRVGTIFSYDTSSVLFLDSAHLNYNTTTNTPFFKASWGGGTDKGRLFIRGKCLLTIPTGKVVTITNPTDLSFDAGSLLKIQTNGQLKIE